MLKGRVSIITGGTRGIGYAIAKKFLENGSKVVLFGSREETVNIALEQLKKQNSNYEVIGFHPNLTDEREIQEIFEKVEAKFGHIDILVNNAGISSNTLLEDYTNEEYEKINDINIKSVFICSKIATAYLRKSKGVILNTSSMVSLYGQSSGVMYPASKFAVNGLTKSLALELAKDGIRVNAVAPGIIETDMVKSLPTKIIEPLIKTIPLKRIGKPEDIANAFLFLASNMASYITGIVLPVDGAAKN